MHEDFQAAVRRLFETLRVAAPRFAEPNRIRLHVEDVALELVDSGLGTLLIEGVVGRISSEQQDRARQTRRILETNIGLLVGSEASVFLRPAAGGEVSLVACASQVLRGLDVNHLTKKVEDVVRAVEYYAPELKAAGRPDRQRRAPVAETFEPALIFRP